MNARQNARSASPHIYSHSTSNGDEAGAMAAACVPDSVQAALIALAQMLDRQVAVEFIRKTTSIEPLALKDHQHA